MLDLNIKKTIFIAILLILNLSIASAKPLAKPSSGQIKKLIKKMLLESQTTVFAGTNSYRKIKIKCKNINIKKINILKIGRASSNYYERSGSYINSEFKVKFSIQGSCRLSSPYRINSGEYDRYSYNLLEAKRHNLKKPTPVMPMDLSGRVPFKHIPFVIYITTDDYGDWYANKHPSSFKESDGEYTDKNRKYLKDLFYKKHGSTVKTWKKEQALAKSKMSDAAERGLSLIKYDRLFTPQVKAQLLSQPKQIREIVFSNYWKLAQQQNRAKTNQFLREVIKQIRLQAARTQSPRRTDNASSSNNHYHGNRRHSHKLPPQGVSHRHGNGPFGKYK